MGQLPSTRFPGQSEQEEGAVGEREFDDPIDPIASYDSPSRALRGVSLALSPQHVNKLDSNMNKALPNNNVTEAAASPAMAVQNRLPMATSMSVREVQTTPSSAGHRRVSTLETAVPSHKLGFDMPSVVSMEILESQQHQTQMLVQQLADCSEARNDAVIQRVSELKRLVEDAEQYLTGSSGDRASRISDVETSSLLSDMSQLSKTESDQSGSGAGGAYGRLRHSDSLLLLTHGQKQLSLPDNTTILLDGDHGSSSDTDSVSTTPNQTPTHSPSQRPKSTSADGCKPPSRPSSMLKPSDSSFGLHSPDVIPAVDGEEKDLEGLIRRLQDDLPLAEGSLIYLDPDIIDLTMIPPPITPEEEGLKMKFPTTINEPPTPFADRDSLENELIAMQHKPSGSSARSRPSPSDLGELQDLTDLAQWTDVASESSCLSDSREMDFRSSQDSLSLSGISTRSVSSLSSRSSTSSLAVQTLTESKRRWIADEKRKHLTANPELDKFLSTVAVPLPPSNSGSQNGSPRHHNKSTSSQQTGQGTSDFSNEDLSAYIIPPPPANVGSTSNNGLAILQKLYAAREGIFQVMREDTAVGNSAPPTPAKKSVKDLDEKDRGMVEMKVRFEQREPHPGVSSKRIHEPVTVTTSGNQSNVIAPKGTTPDLSPASSHSSGYGSLKSIADCSANPPPELPARLPAGQFSPRKNGFAHFKMPALNPTTGALKAPTFGQPFRSAFIDDEEEDDNIPPPPPPPRNPIPRMIIAAAAAASARPPVPTIQETLNAPAPGPLMKSSSQVFKTITPLKETSILTCIFVVSG